MTGRRAGHGVAGGRACRHRVRPRPPMLLVELGMASAGGWWCRLPRCQRKSPTSDQQQPRRRAMEVRVEPAAAATRSDEERRRGPAAAGGGGAAAARRPAGAGRRRGRRGRPGWSPPMARSSRALNSAWSSRPSAKWRDELVGHRRCVRRRTPGGGDRSDPSGGHRPDTRGPIGSAWSVLSDRIVDGTIGQRARSRASSSSATETSASSSGMSSQPAR